MTGFERQAITPSGIAAGVEEFGRWLNEPENYLSIREGGTGNAADLVIRLLETVSSAVFTTSVDNKQDR